jgi:nucleotide-binding universal stress UspA family protein
MRRILAALDLTPHSDRAFERAAQIATQHQAPLTVLHVAAAEVIPDAAAMRSLQQRVRGFSSLAGVAVDYRIEIGDPGAQIARAVRDTAADLVVLGLHHEHPIGDLFVESVANVTVRQCGAPILVVVRHVSAPYRRVLAATDFSRCSKRALHVAVQLAPQATFDVIHVYQTPFPAFVRFSDEELKEYEQVRRAQIESDIREEMDRIFEVHGDRTVRINARIEHDDTDAGIAKAIRQLDPDLVVMGVSGRGFAALVGSRALAFVNEPICDLLVVA